MNTYPYAELRSTADVSKPCVITALLDSVILTAYTCNPNVAALIN